MHPIIVGAGQPISFGINGGTSLARSGRLGSVSGSNAAVVPGGRSGGGVGSDMRQLP
jgi:hypothetical protein